jgi:hypothetical protein
MLLVLTSLVVIFCSYGHEPAKYFASKNERAHTIPVPSPEIKPKPATTPDNLNLKIAGSQKTINLNYIL